MDIGIRKTLSALALLPIFAQATTTFNANDIFALEYANDPQISPNGKQIVYVRNSNDIMKDSTRRNLWLVDVKSGEQTPLFSDENQYLHPRWSPDGKKIAFISNVSGSYQVHVHYLEKNRTALLSQLQSSVSNLTWSPDGKWLAFSQQINEKPSVIAKMPAKPKGQSLQL